MLSESVRRTAAVSLPKCSLLHFAAAALIGLMLLAGGTSAQAQVAPDAAERYVTDLSAAAVAALTQTSTEQREAEVQSLLRENLAINQMAQFVLGSAWRKASEDERQAYLELFSQFVVITNAKRLGGYSGQTFEIGDSTPVGKQDQLVTSKILQDGNPEIQVGWRVRDTGGGALKIIDVVVEGVSMLRTEREQFTSVLRNSGLEGVMTALKKRVDRLAG